MYSRQALYQPKFSVVVHFLVSLNKAFSVFILVFLLDTSQGLDVLGKVCEHCGFPQFMPAFHRPKTDLGYYLTFPNFYTQKQYKAL